MGIWRFVVALVSLIMLFQILPHYYKTIQDRCASPFWASEHKRVSTLRVPALAFFRIKDDAASIQLESPINCFIRRYFLQAPCMSDMEKYVSTRYQEIEIYRFNPPQNMAFIERFEISFQTSFTWDSKNIESQNGIDGPMDPVLYFLHYDPDLSPQDLVDAIDCDLLQIQTIPANLSTMSVEYTPHTTRDDMDMMDRVDRSCTDIHDRLYKRDHTFYPGRSRHKDYTWSDENGDFPDGPLRYSRRRNLSSCDSGPTGVAQEQCELDLSTGPHTFDVLAEESLPAEKKEGYEECEALYNLFTIAVLFFVVSFLWVVWTVSKGALARFEEGEKGRKPGRKKKWQERERRREERETKRERERKDEEEYNEVMAEIAAVADKE